MPLMPEPIIIPNVMTNGRTFKIPSNKKIAAIKAPEAIVTIAVFI